MVQALDLEQSRTSGVPVVDVGPTRDSAFAGLGAALPIDDVADAALAAARARPASAELVCDACGEALDGEPAGHGLLVWTRGEEQRIEEPPLCSSCATAIAVTALQLWSVEEEEG